MVTDNKNDDFVVFVLTPFSFLKHVENIVLTIVPKAGRGIRHFISSISNVACCWISMTSVTPISRPRTVWCGQQAQICWVYILILDDDGSIEHQQLATRDFLLISAQPHAETWVVRRRGTGTWIKGKTHFVMMHFANHATSKSRSSDVAVELHCVLVAWIV